MADNFKDKKGCDTCVGCLDLSHKSSVYDKNGKDGINCPFDIFDICYALYNI
jgi:hypothetical protein